MLRRTLLIAAVLFSLFSVTTAAMARPVALVIGNAAYKHAKPLRNPLNDAEDMATALEQMGFRVVVGRDLSKSKFKDLLSGFVKTLQQADRAVFFYSGHAIQAGGRNYIVPVDAKLGSEVALEFELIPLNLVQRALERHVSSNVIFIDACRDNPFDQDLARSMGTRRVRNAQGLAPAESGVGTLISFSTQPGRIARDGTGRNSPFTQALVKHIATPGRDIASILINVRNDVMRATQNQQIPWEHSALNAPFYFSAPPRAEEASPRAEEAPSPSSKPDNKEVYSADAEAEFWKVVQASQDSALYREYLKHFPKGSFAIAARRGLAAMRKEPSKGQAARRVAAPVVAVQRELRRLGCYGGPIDGAFGLGSRRALQRALGRQTTSGQQLDAALLQRLQSLKAPKCVRAVSSTAAAASAVPRATSRAVKRRPPVTRRKTRKSVRPRQPVRKRAAVGQRRKSPARIRRARPRPQRTAKKNCRFVLNPDSFNDRKAAVGKVVCN